MRERLRTYGGPLLAAVLLSGALVGWVLGDWNDRVQVQQDHLRRFASGLAISVEVALHHQTRDGRLEADEALSALDELMVRSPELRFAALAEDNLDFASAGDPPDSLSDFELASAPGDRLEGDTFVLWMPINPQPLPHGPGWGPPGRPDSPGPWSPPAGRGGPMGSPQWGPPESVELTSHVYVLVLGLSSEILTSVRDADVREGVLRLLLGLLGIAALTAAWGLSIRSRAIAAALELERGVRVHLEELSLAAAGLAHETKNPLGIISGLAQRIDRDPGLSDATREAAGQIIDAADRAAARLGEFMLYARVQNLKPALISARDVVERALAVLQPDMEAANVTPTAEISVEHIVADEDMLLQVLLNLLLNSLQASNQGGNLRIQVEPRERRAELWVHDEGRGISPDLLVDIFKPYVSGRPDGHGLGLSIVRRLVERHGWTIDVTSTPGVGTSIRIGGIEIPSLGSSSASAG